MTKPAILQIGAYPDADQALLDQNFTVHRHHEATDKSAHLARVGPQIRAIATRGDLGASGDVIAACPQLELVAVFGVGYDAVDLAACRARGIRVTNTPDVLTHDVADLAVAMMLAQARGVVRAEAWVRDGSWAARPFPLTHRVHGAKAGILGLGRIGFEIARRLKAFDMDIAYCSRAPKPAAEAQGFTFVPDALALAARSDLFFVALAASAETRHIVNREVIAAVGPQGMIVNISRAANIDENALLDALETGALGSAALDVFEGEPNLNPRFLALPNVLLQPHIGSGTVETRAAMGQLVRDNIAAHFAGRPLLTPVI